MRIQPTTARTVLQDITAPIRRAAPSERLALCNALGLNSKTAKYFQAKFESHGGDIISGECLPNIHVTSSGVSYMETVGNIINVELARIRGQLKRVSAGDLKF